MRREKSRLAELWIRWTGVIAQVATGHVAFGSISDEEYLRLHQELVHVCQASSESTPNPFCRKLLSLALPWVSLETLRKADSQILLDLLRKARAIETAFTGRPNWGMRGWRYAGYSIAVALLGCVVLYFLWYSPVQPLNWWDVIVMARIWTIRGVRFLQGTSVMERTGVIALGVIIVGILLLRSMRRY